MIVPKWKDEHSKTTGILYLLFTHHNGTILEQLSGRVNERKGTKNKQNKFTAFSQQANLKVIVHAKMKLQSLFTQPHIFPNAYTYDFSVEYKEIFKVKCVVTFTVVQLFLSVLFFYIFVYIIFIFVYIYILFKGMVQPKN